MVFFYAYSTLCVVHLVMSLLVLGFNMLIHELFAIWLILELNAKIITVFKQKPFVLYVFSSHCCTFYSHCYYHYVTVITYLLFTNGQCAFQTACSLTTLGRVVKFNALKRTDHIPIPVLSILCRQLLGWVGVCYMGLISIKRPHMCVLVIINCGTTVFCPP